jgi:hypothetical protein
MFRRRIKLVALLVFDWKARGDVGVTVLSIGFSG